jgi:hypothetical protein
MTGPTPIYPIVEKFVNDEYTRLENAQITPWAFFHHFVSIEHRNNKGKSAFFLVINENLCRRQRKVACATK